MSENNELNEEVTSNKEDVKSKRPLKKGFFDYNLSWVVICLTALYAIALVLIFDRYVIPLLQNDATFNGMLLNGLSLVIGCLVAFLVYNGGKILAAKLIGKYQVQVVEFFGIRLTKVNDKFKSSFKIGEILDFHLRFKPKDENCKPTSYLFFGHVTNLIMIAILLVVGYFISQKQGASDAVVSVGLGIFMTGIYSTIIPFYELLPFKSDYDNDMYTFINTRSEENRKAYNILLLNEANSVNNVDFVIPNFSDYNSYYKAQTLYYKYCDNLYHENVEEAIDDLNTIQYYSKYLPVDMLYTISGEKIYIYLLLGENQKANKVFLSIKKDNKKDLLDTTDLTDYRVAVLTAGILANSEADVLDIIDKFNSLELNTSYLRNKMEIQFFKTAVDLVYQEKTDFRKAEVKDFDKQEQTEE